jgi:hypothetical protein
MRIHFPRKHACELEPFHIACQRPRIRFDPVGGARVGFRRGHLQELAGVAQAARQAIQTVDDLFEFGALPAEFLGALRVIPDSGLLEFAVYFLQPLVLIIVIKDTSSKSLCAPRDL